MQIVLRRRGPRRPPMPPGARMPDCGGGHADRLLV